MARTHEEKAHLSLGVAIVVASLAVVLTQAWWALLILLAGIFLLLVNESHTARTSPFDWKRPVPWGRTLRDPIVKRHKVVAVLLILGSLGEVAFNYTTATATGMAFPVVWFLVGIAFATHPQKGASITATFVRLQHKVVGINFVLTGILMFFVRSNTIDGFFNALWPVLMLVLGLQFVFLSNIKQ